MAVVIESVEEIRERWKNRRWMAWAAFFVMVILIVNFIPLVYFLPKQMGAYALAITPMLTALTGLVGWYFKKATDDDISKRSPGIKAQLKK